MAVKFSGIKNFVIRNCSKVKEKIKGSHLYYLDKEGKINAYETASGHTVGFYIEDDVLNNKIKTKEHLLSVAISNYNDKMYLSLFRVDESFNSIFEDISSEKLFKEDNKKTHVIMSYKRLKYRYIKPFKCIGVLNNSNNIILYKNHEEIIITLTQKQVNELLNNKANNNSKNIETILLNPNNVQKRLLKR